MIIPSNSYKINKKTGDIVKRQIVKVKCDDCGIIWESLYQSRKAKQLDRDCCVKCRYLLNDRMNGKIKVSKSRQKNKHICLNCEKSFFRAKSRTPKYCSLKCRDEYSLDKKYGHLFDTFKNNSNEVAYLFGLILGDGHSRKVDQKNTTRICIAFDAKYEDLIETFDLVANKLEINYFIEPKKHKNCQVLGFVLPDRLLKKYKMLYDGAKYSNQPKPNRNVVDNINFAAGLINSDGWCGYANKKYKTIGFTNTVFSITEGLTECLKFNGVGYKRYDYEGSIDKRTGNKSKRQFQVRIYGSREIDKIKDKLSYNLKDFK